MVPQNLTSTAEHSRYFGNLFQRIFAEYKRTVDLVAGTTHGDLHGHVLS